MTVTTLKLKPADPDAMFTLLNGELIVSAGDFLFLSAENMNDVWEAAFDPTSRPTCVDPAAVQAVERAARWAETSAGNFAMAWLTGGEEYLFVMIGEGLVTGSPEGGTVRLTGIPMDLRNEGDPLPASRLGPQVVVGSWEPEAPDVLFVDLVDLEEMTEMLS